MLSSWRDRRDPELADRIDALQSLAPSRRLSGTKREIASALRDLDPSRSVDLQQIFDHLPLIQRSEVATLIGEALQRDPDPRWSTLLLGWLDTTPFVSGRPVWHGTMALLAHTADPRGVLRMERGLESVRWESQPFIGEGRWSTTLAALRGAEVTPTDLDLAPIDAAIEQARQSRANREREWRALWQKLIESRDPELALVVADRLLERGSAQGELMLLQATQGDIKRQRTLIKRHWRGWVGALAPVLVQRSLHFDLGLPDRVILRMKSRPQFDALLDAPAWDSIRDVTITRTVSWGWHEGPFPVHTLLRRHPGIRVVRGIRNTQQLFDVVAGGAPLSVVEIHCTASQWPREYDVLPVPGPFCVPDLDTLVFPHEAAPVVVALMRAGLSVGKLIVRRDPVHGQSGFDRWATREEAERIRRQLGPFTPCAVHYGRRNRGVLPRE